MYAIRSYYAGREGIGVGIGARGYFGVRRDRVFHARQAVDSVLRVIAGLVL